MDNDKPKIFRKPDVLKKINAENILAIERGLLGDLPDRLKPKPPVPVRGRPNTLQLVPKQSGLLSSCLPVVIETPSSEPLTPTEPLDDEVSSLKKSFSFRDKLSRISFFGHKDKPEKPKWKTIQEKEHNFDEFSGTDKPEKPKWKTTPEKEHKSDEFSGTEKPRMEKSKTEHDHKSSKRFWIFRNKELMDNKRHTPVYKRSKSFEFLPKALDEENENCFKDKKPLSKNQSYVFGSTDTMGDAWTSNESLEYISNVYYDNDDTVYLKSIKEFPSELSSANNSSLSTATSASSGLVANIFKRESVQDLLNEFDKTVDMFSENYLSDSETYTKPKKEQTKQEKRRSSFDTLCLQSPKIVPVSKVDELSEDFKKELAKVLEVKRELRSPSARRGSVTDWFVLEDKHATDVWPISSSPKLHQSEMNKYKRAQKKPVNRVRRISSTKYDIHIMEVPFPTWARILDNLMQKSETSTKKPTCMCESYGIPGKHTTNLKNHLSAKHLPEYNEILAVNQASNISNADDEKTEDRIETLKHLCMQLVAIHGRPLSLIGDDPFREILSLATMAPKKMNFNDQQTKKINEKSIKLLIPETAYNIKLKIASEVREKLISLKIDSATCMERKFLGVNIQYIKGNKIIIRNLAVSEVYQNQTAEFLKEKLLEILSEFYIKTEQIYSLTTDNGSNMKKMVKLLKGCYFSDDLIDDEIPVTNSEDDSDTDIDEEEEGGQSEESANLELTALQSALSTDIYRIRGMLCAAHSLQLAIKDAIAENVQVQVALNMARKISKILRISTNRNLLKLANLKVPIIDCTTRWASKYNMLVRLQSLKEFCVNVHEVSRLISEEFWEEIDQYINCLKPLHECTLFLQKEQLTVGDFFMSWIHCKSKINKIAHPFASCLLKCMDKREKSLLLNDAVLEALYLDGRLSVVLSQEECQKAQVLLNQTRDRLNQIRSTYHNESDAEVQVPQEPQAGPSRMLDHQHTTSSYTEFDALEETLLEVERMRGRRQNTISSFNACLRDLQTTSRLPVDTNIIDHWCNKATLLSELAMVAHTVMATPVTQVSVERMFSSLKFILSPLRSNLGPSLVEQMLLIRSNKDLLDR